MTTSNPSQPIATEASFMETLFNDVIDSLMALLTCWIQAMHVKQFYDHTAVRNSVDLGHPVVWFFLQWIGLIQAQAPVSNHLTASNPQHQQVPQGVNVWRTNFRYVDDRRTPAR